MKENIARLTVLALALAAPALAADAPSGAAASPKRFAFKLKPKGQSSKEGTSTAGGLLAPEPDLIDAPTSAVVDYGGFSARSRFFSRGGLLQYVSFGVFQGLSLGGSLNVDGIIGSDQSVNMRAPNVQVKWRFYDGDHLFPSLAVGFDGQGFDYNKTSKRYNERQRGFYVAGTEELGVPGLEAHPSINVSDTDTNGVGAAIPLSYNIRDKVLLMFEWDNINNFTDSRVNAGLRVYVTPHFTVDFSVREIGQGGAFSNGDSRGPERTVQLKYTANF